jgi:hypothetical protein
MRTTLFKRLQPDVKERLLANAAEYEFTVANLIKVLDSNTFWNQLTISDVSNLVIFSDSDMEFSYTSVFCGDPKLIKPENDVI